MDKKIGRIANKKFERISKKISNAIILRDLVKRIYLRKSVATIIKKIKSEDLGVNWWQDVELMGVFKNIYKAGLLPMPYDSVDRIRWIALICVSVCSRENVDYGNFLSPFDYLPNDEIDDSKGVNYKKQIIELRNNLAANGWEYVFKWKYGK